MKTIIKLVTHRQTVEIMTYAIVGICAWICQTIVFIIGIHSNISPGIAMVFGNISGLFVAYFGHVRLTFKRKHKFLRNEFIKFMSTAIFGLLLNLTSVKIITQLLHLDPHYSIIPTIITPLLTFLLSKFWTFKA
jgi:putative flippase GtrA